MAVFHILVQIRSSLPPFTISPNSSDAIHGTITLAASVVELSGTDNKDLINTKATATTGNSVTIVGDGNTGWMVTGSTGIWASEA